MQSRGDGTVEIDERQAAERDTRRGARRGQVFETVSRVCQRAAATLPVVRVRATLSCTIHGQGRENGDGVAVASGQSEHVLECSQVVA